MADSRVAIALPGVDDALRDDIDERVREFERDHDADVLWLVAATLAGALSYLWTLDPLSWTSGNGWFPYITAGLPAYVVAFVVYAALMRAWVLPQRDADLLSTAARPEDDLAAT